MATEWRITNIGLEGFALAFSRFLRHRPSKQVFLSWERS
jgi:hypothetical protein